MVKVNPESDSEKYSDLTTNLKSYVDSKGMIHLVFDPNAEGGETPRGHTKVVETQWLSIPGTEHSLTTRIIIIRKNKKA